MLGLARIVIEGVAHRVVQRGNNRQEDIFVPDDRRQDLALLKQKAKEYQFRTIRRCMERGCPLASDGFLSKLEKVIGRRLRPLANGPPKGARNARPRERKRTPR